jgi:hypothetical protein
VLALRSNTWCADVILDCLETAARADTWDNVRNYITIPSVSEIVLIDTARVRADLFVRNVTGGFPDEPDVIQAGGLIKLASISYDLPLDDAYRDTHLAVRA